ncbi:MAG: hypothetical protein SGPRY_007527, partial [Prymnesium sp.]
PILSLVAPEKLGLSRLRLPGRHHGEPLKLEFSLSELTVHLNPQHAGAVSVDSLRFTWQRGQRSITSPPTPVVETLDQASGGLSRTARALNSLKLPVTLYRLQTSEGYRFEPKPCDLLLEEVVPDEVGEEARDDGFRCALKLDLASHASTRLHSLSER